MSCKNTSGWSRIRESTFEIDPCHPLSQINSSASPDIIDPSTHYYYISNDQGLYILNDTDIIAHNAFEQYIHYQQFIALDEHKDKVYTGFTHPNAQSYIAVYNAHDLSLIGTHEIPYHEYGSFVYNSSSRHFYITEYPNKLLIIDEDTFQVLSTVKVVLEETTFTQLAVDGNSGKIWVGDALSNQVYVVQDT
jgi:DNA-binding beta-propeller fold protein YncE